MLSDASASRRAAHAICREILLQHDQSSKNCFVKMSRRMAEVSDTSSEDPPLGKSQIATIWFNRFAQGIYITLPYTLSVFMVRSFEGSSASEDEIGRNTGMLAAAASVGQCLSSFMWGTISDHIGRKPVLMVGNMSACLSVTALGLAPNYAAAVASRFIGGLFTSSTGVSIKSIIAESYGPVGQARVIGYTTAGYSIGTIAGPTIGGVLASPCDTFLSGSGSCTAGAWLFDRPFLLPCLVSAIMSGLAFLSNTLLMSETNPRFTAAKYAKLSNSQDIEDVVSRQKPDTHALSEQQRSAAQQTSSSDPVESSSLGRTLLQTRSLQEVQHQDDLKNADIQTQQTATDSGDGGYLEIQTVPSAQQTGTKHVQLAVLDTAAERSAKRPWQEAAYSAQGRPRGSSDVQRSTGSESPTLQNSSSNEEADQECVSHQFSGSEETDELGSQKQQLLSGRRRTSSQEEEEDRQSLFADRQASNHMTGAPAGPDPEQDDDRPWYKQGTVVVCLAGGGLITICVNYLDELAPIFASAKPMEGGLGMTASAFAWPLAFGGLMLMLFSIFVYPEVQKKWGRVNCCKAGLLTSTCAALIFPTAHFFASYVWVAQAFMFAAVGIRSIAKIMSLSSSTIIVNTVAPIKQIGSVNGAGQTLNALARSIGPLVAGIAWGECAGSNIAGKQYLPFLGSVAALLTTLFLYMRIQIPN